MGARHVFGCLLAMALLCAGARPADAAQPVRTCVVVETRRPDAAELDRLVKSEVARHPTHVVVTDDCQTHLTIELIEVAEGHFLTGRVDALVPYRVRIDEKSGGLAAALEELLRVVLHNDPLTLEGPKRESFFAASLGKLRREGHMLFGAEAFEWGGLVGGRPFEMPGLGIRIRREVANFQVGARIAAAFRPHDGQARVEPTADIAAGVELAWFASALADTSLYASGLVALEHQRFAGPAPLLGPNAQGSAFGTGVSFGLRVGVELLRTTDVRFDVFALGVLPAFVARDLDGGVVDSWVPSLMFGGGAAF